VLKIALLPVTSFKMWDSHPHFFVFFEENVPTRRKL